MPWEKSLLVIDKFLRLFVKILPVDDKHYLLNRDNVTQPIHMQSYQKQKKILNSFLAFLRSILNLNICQQKMTLIADVFPETTAPKNMLRQRKWQTGRNNVPI